MGYRIVCELRGKQVTFPLHGNSMTVGRASTNDVVIEDASVSRLHAQLRFEGGAWKVLDVGSTNGTRLNDQANTDRPLQEGDVIVFGHVTARFLGDDAEENAPMLVNRPEDERSRTLFRSTVDFAKLARGSGEVGPAARAPSSERLERLVRVLSEASKAILASESLEDTFRRVLDLIFQDLPVQRGFIMLWDEERQDLVVRCTKVKEPAAGASLQFSRTIAEKVFRENLAVLTRDAQTDDRFASGQSILSLGIRSAMAAPLWDGDKVNGLICVDTTRHTQAFNEFDLDLLSALGNHLAVAVERAHLQRQALQKEKLERELAVAREIQIRTFPREVPALPGYDLAGFSRPADATGGDTYDLIPVDGNRLVLLVGDATGHGIGPALSVTQVRAMLRLALRMQADLDAAFVHINDQLVQDLADNRYVTAFLGLVDNRTHTLRYHSAGQGPILSYRAAEGAVHWLGPTAMPMGFLPVRKTPIPVSLDVAPGDIVGLITDGVFEAENPSGEMFGRERVAQVVRDHAGAPPREAADALLRAVDEFCAGAPQGDDITIVLLRRSAG